MAFDMLTQHVCFGIPDRFVPAKVCGEVQESSGTQKLIGAWRAGELLAGSKTLYSAVRNSRVAW